MDTSQWYSINPNIKIIRTKKKFYNRYNHKLVYRVTGASSIPNNKSIENFNFRIGRYHNGVVSASIADVYNLYYERDKNLKFRIEGNALGIFCEDIDYLYQTASTKLKNHAPQILSTVLDQIQQDLLEQGLIIVKTPTDYIWRINLRSGFCKNLNDRHGLAKYLVNLGDEVKITKNLLAELASTTKYWSGGYFHVRDPKLADMIRLIVPNLVKSVDQLVVQ